MNVVEYVTVQGNPIVKVFYRYKGDKRGCRTIRDFEPYFLVESDAKVKDDDRIKRVEETDFVSLHGKPLKKIVTKLPSDVSTLRKLFRESYEADIPFVDRFRIDKKGNEDEMPEPDVPPRIFFFDIETTSLDVRGHDPIISIACYDSYYKKYVMFVWQPNKEIGDPHNFYQHEGFYKKMDWSENQTVHVFGNELDMLKKFCDFFEFCDPDIVTGWFSDEFDLPYLINRLDNLDGIGSYRLSPMNKCGVSHDKGWIKGRVCFDMLPAYKKIHENQLDSFKLDEVAKAELGYGKTGEGGDIIQMWTQRFDDLITYNFMDVEILVELDKKIKIFDFYMLLADKVNASIEDTLLNSKLVDMFLLNYCHNQKVALPTNKNAQTRKIKGAKVFKPDKGLKYNLAILDLKSLYPSIIMTFNMCAKTCKGFMDFAQEPKGMIPTVLEELMEERAKLKAEGRNEQQRVVKELMNSFYGVMMFAGFRLMNPDIGESITHIGREIIQWTKKVVEETYGYKVVYGDTDSIFVEGVETEEQAQELRKTINDSYMEFVAQFGLKSHKFEIEYEGHVDVGLFVGKKKRYALKMGEDLKIRGFEYRRSNVPRLGKELQKSVLEMLLSHGDKKEIDKYVQSIEKMIKDEWSDMLDEIGVPASITKPLSMYKTNSQHIRAAQYSNDHLDSHFGVGDKMLMFYIKSCPSDKPKTDIIALDFGEEIPKGFVLDVDRHIEKVLSLVDPIYEVLDWTRLDLAQKTLLTF